MSENSSLDEILNEEPAKEVEELHERNPIVDPPSEILRDEKGRFAPKDTGEKNAEVEKSTTEEAPPATEKETVPVAALKDERGKRQALESEIGQLREQLASLTKQVQQPEAPPPSIWEDEQGWQQHFGQSVTQTAVNQAAENARLWASEFAARKAYPDFEAKQELFKQLAQQNPGLIQEALGSFDPWDKAYQIAANHERMQSLGVTNVSDLETKLREQIKAELLQEAEKKLPSAPPSITGERSVGSRGGPEWTGPTPLKELLG